jgi:hypothetical protein
VPTAAEAGLPGFAFLNWFAHFALRGIPDAVVDRYADLVRRALAVPDVAGCIRAAGDLPGAGTACSAGWCGRGASARNERPVSACGCQRTDTAGAVIRG